MCSDEFLKRGPQFLTFRVFSVYNYDKNHELNVKEVIDFCKMAEDKFDDCIRMAISFDTDKSKSLSWKELENGFRSIFTGICEGKDGRKPDR